jgi:NADPH:quinone reductase-like Zn-dependent oxidoreductase
MRITQFTNFGGPEVLVTRQRPEPAAREGRVRVRVLARAVNPVDIALRSGALAGLTPELPAVPGWDFAGDLIDPSGSLKPGSRVFGFIPGFAEPGRGSYADVVSVEPGWIAALEPSVDPAAGAVAALNASTALLALRIEDGAERFDHRGEWGGGRGSRTTGCSARADGLYLPRSKPNGGRRNRHHRSGRRPHQKG